MGSPSVTHTQAAAHLLLAETLLLGQTLCYREWTGDPISDKLSFDRNCQAGLTIYRSTNP